MQRYGRYGDKPEAERAKHIQKLLNDGMKLVDIADCLNMTRNAVQCAIYRYGLNR